MTVLTVCSGLNKGFKWVIGSSVHGCWLGHYENEKQTVVKNYIQPGMIVFDIGANAGFYTLAFSRLVGKAGHVWAFEPFSENAYNLIRHLKLNNIANVTLVQAAVTAKGGIAGFAISANNSMGKIIDNGDYLVPTITLDEFRANHGIPIPDLIKIDVEGAESEVLEGAIATLSAHETKILLSLHGRDQEKRCCELLRRLDYHLFYLDGKPVSADVLNSDEIIATPVISN